MTFEHIPDTGRFIHMISKAVDGRDRTVVFFQVPNATRILDEGAFWDVYYEHCSYFSASALERLFRAAGFAVLDLWTGYDDQYLRSEEHTSELQSLMRISYAVFCLKKKKDHITYSTIITTQ